MACCEIGVLFSGLAAPQWSVPIVQCLLSSFRAGERTLSLLGCAGAGSANPEGETAWRLPEPRRHADDGKTVDTACWVAALGRRLSFKCLRDCAHLGLRFAVSASGLFLCPCHGGAYSAWLAPSDRRTRSIRIPFRWTAMLTIQPGTATPGQSAGPFPRRETSPSRNPTIGEWLLSAALAATIRSPRNIPHEKHRRDGG